MKRVLALALIAVLAMSLSSGSALAGKKKKKQPKIEQKVEGQVHLPAPFLDDSGCYAGLHRRAVILGGDAPNGIIGYHFDVDEKTWGLPFVLEPTGGQGHVDLDIYFYLADFGTPEDVVNDPGGAGAPPAVSFNTREAGGEAEIVPEEAKRVIVCMYGGQQGVGFEAPFTYTAGNTVKLPKE